MIGMQKSLSQPGVPREACQKLRVSGYRTVASRVSARMIPEHRKAELLADLAPLNRPAMNRQPIENVAIFKVAPEVGLEPTTHRLTADCSTIELLWNSNGRALYKWVTGASTGDLGLGAIGTAAQLRGKVELPTALGAARYPAIFCR